MPLSEPRRRSLLVAGLFVAAIVLQMPAWTGMLRHNLARAESVVGLEPSRMNRLVLSADFLEYRDYFRQFPTNIEDLHGKRIDIEYYKRPLYGPITGLLSVVVSGLGGAEYPRSMEIILSFYASLAVALLGLLALRLGCSPVESILTAAIGAFSFSWLSIFSLPESYSLSVCAALFALHSGLSLAGRQDTRITAPLVRHLAVTVLAAWIYLPLSGAALMVLDGVRGRRQWLTVIAPCLAVALFATALPHLIRGAEDISLQVSYASRWAAATHLLDPVLLLRVGAAFLWFGLIAPVADFVNAAPNVDFESIFRRVPSALGVLLLCGCYGWLVAAKKENHRYPARGATLWLILFFLFHVVFNPGEVLLYLSVPTAVLLYVAAAALAGLAGNQPARRHRMVVAAMVLLAMSLALINLPSTLGL